MIAAALAAWKYRGDIAIVGGLVLLLILGLVIWGQHATIAGQAESLTAKDKRIEAVTGERDTARDDANHNADELTRYKAERDKADAASAEDAKRVTARTEAVLNAHKEIARVAKPAGPAAAAGPYSAAALDRLRAIKAGRAADGHAGPGREGAAAGAAAHLPAGP